MDTTSEHSDSRRIDQQLEQLGPAPTEPSWLATWELRVLDIVFGGHTRGCDCPPCFTCVHDPYP